MKCRVGGLRYRGSEIERVWSRAWWGWMSLGNGLRGNFELIEDTCIRALLSLLLKF